MEILRFTEDETQRLVEARIRNESLFKDKIYGTTKAWHEVQKHAGLDHVDIKKIMKKWVYIKNKYKDLLIPTDEGIENEEEQQKWPLFSTIKDYSIQHGLLQISNDPFLIRKKPLKKRKLTKTKNDIKSIKKIRKIRTNSVQENCCCFCTNSLDALIIDDSTQLVDELVIKIEKCFNLKIDPSDEIFKVCCICKDSIQKFYDFQQMSLSNYEKIKNFKMIPASESVLIEEIIYVEGIDVSDDYEMYESEIVENRTLENKVETKVSADGEQNLDRYFSDDEDLVEEEVGTEDDDTIDSVTDRKKSKKREAISCDQCGKLLASAGNLTSHLKTHSNTRDFVCTVCERGFKFKAHLKKHMYTHTGERNYKCPYCEKDFATSSCRGTHIKAHLNDRKHICKLCSKAFLAPYYLKKHMRIHTGEKPYKCTFCDKDFTCSWNLKTHIRTHTKERPYKCPKCPKQFSHKSTYNNHIKKHENTECK